MSHTYKPYRDFCKLQKSLDRYRTLPLLVKQAPGKRVINFSSNDYLGLSKSLELAAESIKAIKKFGVGSTGSRLITGNNEMMIELEKQIALDIGTESALVLNSGFQTNFAVLSSLLDKKILKQEALVFFDKFNHSSLYQAVFLSGAKLLRYHHNNMQHLSDLLVKYSDDPRPKFIVTETLFGMDGDVVDIKNIFQLAKTHKAFLYFDEAHAIGLLGDNGYGLSTEINLNGIPYLLMGTLSKAIGTFGGFIGCSHTIKDYIINKCSGFIHTTSLPPNVIAAAAKGWELIGRSELKRKDLFIKSQNLRVGLGKLGLNIGNSTTHIIPIIFNDEGKTLEVQDKLREYGIFVGAVRPPSVPPLTSRIRIVVNSDHTDQDVDHLLYALKSIIKHL